jgi:predicted flap endonuclease-1-like 5' DNA nuclease
LWYDNRTLTPACTATADEAKIEAKVEGIEFMSFRVLWFVLAGFVLGFATSTLWEWLYYRRKRLQRVERQYPALPEGEVTPGERWQPAYRSAGILLESEAAAAPAPFTQRTPAGKPTPVAPSVVPTAESQPTASESAAVTTENPAVSRLSDGRRQHGGTGAAISSALTTTTNRTSPPGQPRSLPPATEEESAGNPQMIARAGARAAALLAGTAPATAVEQSTPTPASAAPSPSIATAAPTAAATPTGEQNTLHRPTDYPDDLALIKGIGEAYKRRLYATGIYTWRQLAVTDTESLRSITRAKPNADIKSWQTQAHALAEKYNRTAADFHGPLDDFTRIEGIGAITADILYKAGLCTYEQLAGALPDELARIVPAPTVGNENDFDGWINDAARLANAKRRNNGMLP